MATVVTETILRRRVGNPSTGNVADATLTGIISDALEVISRYRPRIAHDVTSVTVKNQQEYSPPAGLTYVDDIVAVYVYDGMTTSANELLSALSGGPGDDENPYMNEYLPELFKRKRQREVGKLATFEWDIDMNQNKFLIIPPPTTAGYIIRLDYKKAWANTTGMSDNTIMVYNKICEVLTLKYLLAQQDIDTIQEGSQRAKFRSAQNYEKLLDMAQKELNRLSNGVILVHLGS